MYMFNLVNCQFVIVDEVSIYTGVGFVNCTNLWRTVLTTSESELNYHNTSK